MPVLYFHVVWELKTSGSGKIVAVSPSCPLIELTLEAALRERIQKQRSGGHSEIRPLAAWIKSSEIVALATEESGTVERV